MGNSCIIEPRNRSSSRVRRPTPIRHSVSSADISGELPGELQEYPKSALENEVLTLKRHFYAATDYFDTVINVSACSGSNAAILALIFNKASIILLEEDKKYDRLLTDAAELCPRIVAKPRTSLLQYVDDYYSNNSHLNENGNGNALGLHHYCDILYFHVTLQDIHILDSITALLRAKRRVLHMIFKHGFEYNFPDLIPDNHMYTKKVYNIYNYRTLQSYITVISTWQNGNLR